MPALATIVAATQGTSYLGFSAWALLRRDHYRRVHDLRADDWILNAHAGWLGLVGMTLLSAASRGQITPETRRLGLAAAAALATNDALLRRRIATIYTNDLLYEMLVVTSWLVAGGAARPAATRRRA